MSRNAPGESRQATPDFVRARVHLVGSVALASSGEVFRQVAAKVGRHLVRMPDGETGERRTPFPLRQALHDSIRNSPGVEFRRQVEICGLPFKFYALAPGWLADDVQLGSLGFAAAAIDSYREFSRLRAQGAIPAGVRLQVCIPTPFMVAMVFSAPECLREMWPVFERAMRRELAEIAAAIPHRELAIQWDVSPEITEVLEHRNGQLSGLVSRDEIIAGIARITEAVPVGIETGWHLCYGDTGQSTVDRETHHAVEPRDLGILVELANDLCALIQRPLSWVHMPVPRERDDGAYFAPLAALRLKPDMQLFLGLVHRYDGREGALRRAAAARVYYPVFGVGTECGMGRRAPEDIPALLDLHNDVANAL